MKKIKVIKIADLTQRLKRNHTKIFLCKHTKIFLNIIQNMVELLVEDIFPYQNARGRCR
jgi:hypothetical protein